MANSCFSSIELHRREAARKPPSTDRRRRFLMPGQPGFSSAVKAGMLVVVSLGLVMLGTTRTVLGQTTDNGNGQIARGAGTTIIHGGTGSPNFVPVITTLAFHAERSGGGVTGEFECLALAPDQATGPGSGQFTVNAMYVVGKVTGASVHEDTA